MNKKTRFLIPFFLFLLIPNLMGVGTSESRIPSGVNNWLQVAENRNDGGTDPVMVVFFEISSQIPDDTDLFFGIRDPECNNEGGKDTISFGSTSNTYYYLYGGSGAYTDSAAHSLDYWVDTNYNSVTGYDSGTELEVYQYDETFTGVNGSPSVTADGEWVYFPAVRKTQGEKVGDNYYFRIVVIADPTYTTRFKNAFQLVASLTDGSDPVEAEGIRSFADSWVVDFQEDNSVTWQFYPFVPEDAANSLNVRIWDIDNQEGPATLYNIAGTSQGTVDPGASNDFTGSYTINTGTDNQNGTWRLDYPEVNDGGIAENTAEIWFENSVSGAVYRTYSHFYQPDQPYRITASQDTTETGLIKTITLQIVDENDNPVPYKRYIYVDNPSGNIQLSGTVNTPALGAGDVVYTNDDGYVSFTCTNTVTETVTFTFLTDGTNGSSSLDGNSANDTLDVSFSTLLVPTFKSTGVSFSEGNTFSPIDLTITENSNLITDTGDIHIRIPSGVDAVWDTSLTDGSGVDFTFAGTALGNLSSTTVSYQDSDKTLVIDVGTAFTSGEVLTITGLAFTAVNTASSGDFELSYDGGSTYNVYDTRTGGDDVVISGTSFVWDGSTDGTFSDGTNWVGGTAPSANDGTESVIFTYNGTSPVLTSSYHFKNLTIQPYAHFIVYGTATDIQVDNTFVNGGFLEISDDGSNASNVTFSGSAFTATTSLKYVNLTGTAGVGGTVNYALFGDLVLTDGNWTIPSGIGDITATSSISLNGGTLYLDDTTQNIYLNGDWSNGGAVNIYQTSTTTDNGNLILTGSGDATISNDTTFRSLSCSVPGKTVTFASGSNQTVTTSLTFAGDTSSPLYLTGAAAWTITEALSESVSYVDVAYGTASASITAYYSTDSGNNTNWTFPGKTTTWDGSNSTVVTLNANWDNNSPTISGQDNVIIPDVSAGSNTYPVLAADWDLGTGSLSIESGANITMGGFTLTSDILSNDGTINSFGSATVSSFSNTGTINALAGSTLSGATMDTDSGLVSISGGSSSPLPLGDEYYDLTIAGGTWTLDAALVVNGDLVISGGTLDTNGFTLSVAGDIYLSGGSLVLDTDMTLNGDFYNTTGAAALTHTAILTLPGGTHRITGSNTWYDFACSTGGASLRFQPGETQTISNSLTIQGASGSYVTMTGTSASTWSIGVTGATVDVDYADINYSTVDISTLALYSQTSNGGNTNWVISSDGTAAFTWQGDESNLWNTPGNWDMNAVPVAGAQVTIPAAAADPDPVLDGDTALLDTLTLEAGTTLSTYDGSTGDYDLSVSGAVTNNGTLIFTGNESVTFTSGLDTVNGTVRYETGFTGGSRNISFYTFNNLEIDTTGTLTAGANDIVVNGYFDHASGTLGGTTGNITVAGQATLDGTITYSSTSTIDINGGIASPITGSVTTTGGSIDISGIAADITFTTGLFNAGTGSIIIDAGAFDILDDGDATIELTADTITLASTGNLIGTSDAVRLDTASTNPCTMTLPSGNVAVYIEHTGDLNPSFGGNRNGIVALSLTASGNMTLPAGVTLGSGTTMLSFVSGGTLTVPATTSLTTTSGAMTLTGVTLTIPAGAGTITSTTTGTITLTQTTGDFTLLRALTGDTGTINITSNGGAIDLQQAVSLTAGSGTTNLVAFGAITQTAAGIVTSDVLTAATHDGATTGYAITLDQVNFTESLSLQSLDGTTGILAGNLTYVDDGGFDIVLIETTGFTDLTCTTGTPNNVFGDITQSGTITTGELAVKGTGDIYLDDTGNDIPVFAASTTGWVYFAENQDVTIGSVNGTNGISAANVQLIHDGDALYSVSMIQTQPILCTGLILEGAYGNFNFTDPLGTNSISDIALYGSAAGTPLRALYTQTGDITLDEIYLDTTTFSTTPRDGSANAENLTLTTAGDLSVNNANVASWEVGGDFALTADELLDNGVTLTTGGDVDLNLTNAAPTALGNTWIFDGTTDFVLSGSSVSLNNLQLGTAAQGGSLAFSGAGAATLDINGSVTAVSPLAGTNDLDITADTLTIAGTAVDFTNLDSLTSTGSSVTFDGGALQTVTSNGMTYNNVIVNGTGISAVGAFDADGTVVFTAGACTAGGTFTADGLVTFNGGTLAATGAITANGGITVNTGGFTANGTTGVTGDVTIAGGTSATNDTLTIGGNLIVSAGTLTGGNGTADLIQINNGDLTVSGTGVLDGTGYIDVNGAVEGDVNLSGTGSLDGNDRQINVEGDWTETAAVFDESTGTSRITFDGAASSLIQTTNGLDDLYVINDTTLDMSSNVTCANVVLTNNTGTSILDTNGNNLTATGSVTGTGTLRTTNGETVDVEGDITPGAVTVTGVTSPAIQAGSSFAPTAFTPGNSSVVLDEGNAASLGGYSFYDLSFAKDNLTDTVISTGGLTVTNSLTLTTGTWQAANGANPGLVHTVAGGWDSTSGTFLFTAGTSEIVLTGGSVIHTALQGFYDFTADGTVTLAGGLEVSNDFLVNVATGDLDTTALNNYAISVGNSFTNNGVFRANGSTVDVDGSIANTGTFNGGTSTFQLTSGTVINGFGGAFAGTTDNFYNLIIDSGAWTISSNLVVRNLTQINGGSLDTSGFSFTTGSGELLGGELTGDTAITVQTGNLLIDDAASRFYGSAALTVTAGNLNIQAGDFDPSGTVDLTAGNLNASSGDTMNPTGVITVGGTANFTGGTFTAGNTLNSTGLLSVNGGILTANGTLNANGALTLTLGTLNGTGNINITGTASLDGGTLTAGSRTITCSGNWTETAAVFDSSGGPSTVRITGASTVTSNGASSFDNFQINAAAQTVLLGSALTCNNDLTVTAGTLDTDSGNSFAMTVTGTFTNSGTFSANGSALSVGGDFTNTGTLNSGSSTVTLNGVALQTLTFSGQSLANLTVNNTGNASIGDAGSVTGILTLTAGTLDIDSYNLSFGSISNGTTLYLNGASGQSVTNAMDTTGGTVVFDGAAGDTTFAGLTGFYNLTLTGAAPRVFPATLTVYAGLDASGVTAGLAEGTGTVLFDGTAGTYTPPTADESYMTFYDLEVAATRTLTSGGDLYISHDWTMNTGGSYSDVANGVFFVDNLLTSTLTGDTSFFDFTCTAQGKDLVFTDGSEQTINGALTLTGASGTANMINLAGTSTGGWTLNNAGNAESVDYVTVSYGQVNGNSITADNSVNVGDSSEVSPAPCWVFTPKTVVWLDAAATTDWSTGSNWDFGYAPNDEDTATINDTNGGNQPVLTENITVANLQIDNDNGQGSLTVGGSFTLTVTGAFNNDGDLYRSGTSSVNVTDTDSGRTIYNTAGAIQVYAGDDYYNLLIDGATLTLGGTCQVAGDLAFANSGILTTTGTDLTVAGTVAGDGTGTLRSAGAETLDLAGNVTVNAIDFTGGSPTVQAAAFFTPAGFTAGSSTVVLDDGNDADLAGLSYYNLTFGKTADTVVVTSTGGLTVTNSLTMTTGEWDAQTYTHSISDGWDSTSGTFLFTSSTSTVALDSGSVNHQAGEGFHNLTVNGAITMSGAVTVTNDLIQNGTGTLTGDELWFDDGPDTAHTMTVNGTSSFTTVIVSTGNTVTLAGAGTFTTGILQTGDTAADNDTAVFDAASVDIAVATLYNGGRLRLVGDQTATVTAYDITSGWTEYYGGSGITLNNASFDDFWNLEISGGTYTLGQDLLIRGSTTNNYDGDGLEYNDEGLFLTGGTLNGGAGDFTLTVYEAFSTSGGGTFVPGNSQVGFSQGASDYFIDAPAAGTITFYQLNVSYLAHTGWGATNNVTADTSVGGKYLYFNPNATVAVTGYLALSGNPATPPTAAGLPTLDPAPAYEAASTYLKLRPTTDPAITTAPAANEYWFIDVQSGAELFMENVCAWYSEATSNPFVVQTNVYTYACLGWYDFVDILNSQTQDLDDNGKIDRILLTTTVALNYDYSNFEATVSGYTVNGYANGPLVNQFYILVDEKSYLDTDVTPTLKINTNTSLLDSATGTKLVIVPPYTADNSSTQTIADSAAPVIGYTLAVAGRSDMFIHFSEPVFNGASDPTQANLTFSGGLDGTKSGFTLVTPATAGGGAKEALILFSAALSTADITGQTVDATALQDSAGNAVAALARNSTHAISDLLIGPTNNGPVEPLWARDQTTASSSGAGTGVINEFDGSEHLKDEDITLQAHLNSDYASAGWNDNDITLRFVQNPGDAYLNGNGLWLDDFIFGEDEVSGLDTYPVNSAVVKEVNGTISDGPTNHVWNFDLSAGDITNNLDLSFLFYLPNVGATPYAGRYAARIEDDTATDWYRRVYPWVFGVHDIVDQGNGVSILNNVINPLKGEQTTLYYDLTKGGMVSVQIFDLAGGLVEILHRGRQDAGEYSLSWNGTNRSNNAVARGIYFVRIVAPGIDEMRKVLVVK